MSSRHSGQVLRGAEYPTEPYPGLRPFESNEWPIFFGREKNVAETVDRLIDRQFVALHGDSGCGKSSLIRAGVIPRLESDQARGGGVWFTGSMRPRATPLSNLAVALANLMGLQSDDEGYLRVRRALNRGSAAAEAIHEILGDAGAAGRCLLIDQFEEIFHLAQRGGFEEVRQFVAVIVALQRNPPPGLHIVLTMRSEFIGACARFEGLAETFNSTQFLLPAMDRHSLLRAIAEPARIFGGVVRPDLVEAILEDCGREQDKLPLIQHALMLMYGEAKKQLAESGSESERRSWALGLDYYVRAGGAKQLLSDHADRVHDDVVRDLNHRDETATLIERMFKSLTAINDEGQAIRSPQTVAQLVAATGSSPEAVLEIVDRFSKDGVSFLKVLGAAQHSDSELVDISHEALLRNWGRLKVWMESKKTFAQPATSLTRHREVTVLEERVRSFVDETTELAEETRHHELMALIARISDPYSPLPEPGRRLLMKLRAARAFDRLHVAAAEMARKQFLEPLARRMNAMALIELDRDSEALAELLLLRSRFSEDGAEMLECAGLEGRVYKQRFLAARRAGLAGQAELQSALEAYGRGRVLSSALSADDPRATNSWFDVNYLALVCRAERDGLDIGRHIDTRAIARSVLGSVASDISNGSDGSWLEAARGEAALALEDYELATEALMSFAAQQGTNGFAVGAVYRQIRDVWLGGTPNERIQALCDKLAAQLLAMPNGAIELEFDQLRKLSSQANSDEQSAINTPYERLFGREPVTIEWAARMISLGQYVCRIDRSSPGGLAQPVATGLLVDARLLSENWAAHEVVLMANEHVISGYGREGLKLEEAIARITAKAFEKSVLLDRVLWCSDRMDHDVTIISLKNRPPGLSGLSTIAPLHSLRTRADGTFQPITVLGYPGGASKLHMGIDNLDTVEMDIGRPQGEPERLWYRAPTHAGSSGSLILNWRTLEPVGIHHRENRQRRANEGISLESIREAIRLRPEGWNGPVR
jgi:hypothetical protein